MCCVCVCACVCVLCVCCVCVCVCIGSRWSSNYRGMSLRSLCSDVLSHGSGWIKGHHHLMTKSGKALPPMLEERQSGMHRWCCVWLPLKTTADTNMTGMVTPGHALQPPGTPFPQVDIPQHCVHTDTHTPGVHACVASLHSTCYYHAMLL